MTSTDENESTESEIDDELPKPRKKTYASPLKPESEPKEKSCRSACNIAIFILFVGIVVTLIVLSTGDRPLASAIRQSMQSSGNLISNWFEQPLNDTDALGNVIVEEQPPAWVDIWSTTTTLRPIQTPPTKRPSADVVTPSAVFSKENYRYEFFKHTWTLEVAISICGRRNGLLIYIDDDDEMESISHWIRFNVTDKLPYTRAGHYWTGGFSQNSNPSLLNYKWSWRGRPDSSKTGYQNFCPNYAAGFEGIWETAPNRNLNIVMDFRRGHIMEPTMGCWRLQFPMVDLDTLGAEQMELTGLPFICKMPVTK
ncbi:Uncharacterized protein APZ42_007897 [Daphnia magna]|uniref:Uncharacterized protein n=1 Tax=Daphnia magna TaxID=35525 RepID=A0A0N8DSE5_9CRUS|nr:Uncharacterized protein APZ42_007897 [Daphnia magna]